MRSSKRDFILDAALGVVDEEGVAAVTFDSVAAASGISRGGLLYHFPSKEAMIQALHEHLATKWEAELINELGKDPEAATDDERLVAYSRLSIRSATGPELLLMLESTASGLTDPPWRQVMSRWLPDPSAIDPTDPAALRRLTARLAADGLWLADSMSDSEMPTALRAALVDFIASMVEPANNE